MVLNILLTILLHQLLIVLSCKGGSRVGDDGVVCLVFAVVRVFSLGFVPFPFTMNTLTPATLSIFTSSSSG